MIEERFAHGVSSLHSRDARVKVIAAAVFITVVAVAQSFLETGIALLLSLLLFYVSQLPVGAVAKRLAAANTFTLFLWLTLPFTYGTTDVIELGWLELSKPGVRLAALITLKTNTIVLAFIALLSTSSIASLGHALESLKISRRLTFLLLFSYRYVFVIYEEYLKLRTAAQLRSFKPQTNIHTYRTFGYLFGMTMVRSWNRSQRVYQAMLLRGFNGVLISLEQSGVTNRDILFLFAMLVASAGLFFLQFVSL